MGYVPEITLPVYMNAYTFVRLKWIKNNPNVKFLGTRAQFLVLKQLYLELGLDYSLDTLVANA